MGKICVFICCCFLTFLGEVFCLFYRVFILKINVGFFQEGWVLFSLLCCFGGFFGWERL